VVDSQSTPARQRPSIVSISSYLLFLFLACQVISLIITLSTIGKTRDALRDAYAGSNVENADQVGDVFYAIGLGSAILVLLLAVVLGVLALFQQPGPQRCPDHHLDRRRHHGLLRGWWPAQQRSRWFHRRWRDRCQRAEQ
jgi:hypothetical protein